MQHVAILHNVVLPLKAQLAGIPRSGFAPESDVISVRYCFCPDEPVFEVREDGPGGLRRFGALGDCPGAVFLRACSEKSDQSQERIASTDDAIEPRLFEAHRLEIILLL